MDLRSLVRVPRRTDHSPAHRKVAVLGAVLFALTVAVSTVGVLGLRSIDREVSALTEREAPDWFALADVRKYMLLAELALEESTTNGTAADMSTELEEFDLAVAGVHDSYQDFIERATARGGLTVDVAPFEQAQQRWYDAAMAHRSMLATATVPPDAAQQELRSAFDSAATEIVALAEQYEGRVAVRAERVSDRDSTARTMLVAVAGFAALAGIIACRSSYRAARAQHEKLVARDALREAEAARRDDEERINRSLEFARSEEDALATVEAAARQLFPSRPSEVLLADASHAHLQRVACTHEAEGLPGCSVPTPRDCPAVNKAQTLQFTTSETFDACPYLRGRPSGPLSAVCVPISINGAAAGVLHSTGDEGVDLEAGRRSTLEQLATRTGERVGVLRAFRRSESQAATDSLTGLLNRRSFENEVAAMMGQGVPMSLAFGDLDHFKLLNDTYGHDAGDRALRAFARTVRQSLRPTDLVARWGGEEFVVALPDTSRDEAVAVLDRVRSELARVVAAGGVPSFTVSFGVADRFDADDLESLIEAADRALLQAKDAGRDRVVVSGAGS